MVYPSILVFALLVFAYGLVSKRLTRTVITGPIVFTTAGLLLAFSLPVEQHLSFDLKAFSILGKIALGLVLFTDATHIRVRDLFKSASIPGRLLGIAMPLVIIFGAVVAVRLFTELTIWEAALLATILAPTDAGLGHAIMSSKRVPERIRQALNVEAGLNDGLAIPFLMLFIALARITEPQNQTSWIVYTGQQIGLGLVVGVIVGGIGGWLIQAAGKRGWITEAFQQLSLLAMALLSFFIAEEFGGNEFIATFVAGLVVKLNFEDAGQEMLSFSEAWGQLLNFFVFFIFGMITADELNLFGPEIWLYAVLSLTLVRILPVLISMSGTHLQISTKLFLGWFGPRGLASIILGMIMIKEEAGIPGQLLIEYAVMATVLLSVFAHGVTAAPGINLYARQMDKLPEEAPEKGNPRVVATGVRKLG